MLRLACVVVHEAAFNASADKSLLCPGRCFDSMLRLGRLEYDASDASKLLQANDRDCAEKTHVPSRYNDSLHGAPTCAHDPPHHPLRVIPVPSPRMNQARAGRDERSRSRQSSGSAPERSRDCSPPPQSRKRQRSRDRCSPRRRDHSGSYRDRGVSRSPPSGHDRAHTSAQPSHRPTATQTDDPNAKYFDKDLLRERENAHEREYASDNPMDDGGDDDTADSLSVDTPKVKTDVSVEDLQEEEDLAEPQQQLIADVERCERAHSEARNAVDQKRNAAENVVHKAKMAKMAQAQAQALAEETFAEFEAARKRLAEWNENEIMRKTGVSPANFLL